MKRITGLTAALFLVLGITATSFAQDTMKQDTMMKQDDQMMSKKPMMKKSGMTKEKTMKKHHRRHRTAKMMKKSMMK
jgi:pentapeptide MXKDX repeat protein